MGEVRRVGRHAAIAAPLLQAAVAAVVLHVAVAAGAAPCDAWPGEPDPLPTLEDPDPLRAEWARLRAQELSRVARRFESEDPLRAQQMWRRLLCMDPANDEALAGVIRSQAVRVHRPALVDGPFDAAPGRDPWESLDAPIGMRSDVDPRQWAIEARLRELREAVIALDEQVRMARFEEALAAVPKLREALANAPPGGMRTNLIAQTEVLAATAELALGQATGAEASLLRALDANPDLTLDPDTTPRKVLRALEVVRESR